MLEKFRLWANGVSSTSEAAEVEILLTDSIPSDNSSGRLDIDASEAIGRLTFWESGDYVAEVISLSDGETTYLIQGRICDSESFSSHFGDFLRLMGCTSIA